ncbi:MAG: cytochrome c [Spirochaetia bacterium]|nr:cytochrome c [Spirochaetia bacterium]
MKKISKLSIIIIFAFLLSVSCKKEGIGIGPVESVELGEAIDDAKVEKGAATFKLKCTPCHKITVKHVGPVLKDVTTRRKPEWIMNMILNPEEMIAKDPTAKKLLLENNMMKMVRTGISQDEARDILELFRKVDEGKELPDYIKKLDETPKPPETAEQPAAEKK